MGTAGIAAGLACGVAAAACYELGYVAQAGDARAEDRNRPGLLLRLARRRAWLRGTTLVVCGLLLQLVALDLAPLSVVQPALVLGLGLLARARGAPPRGARRAARPPRRGGGGGGRAPDRSRRRGRRDHA